MARGEIQSMHKIIAKKFDQNDNLRDRLLNTKGCLYEATKSDLDFTCGFTLSQAKEIRKDNLKGKKLLGEILCAYHDNRKGN